MAQMAALLRHYLQENGLNDPALGDAIPFSRIVVVTSWPEKVFHTSWTSICRGLQNCTLIFIWKNSRLMAFGIAKHLFTTVRR